MDTRSTGKSALVWGVIMAGLADAPPAAAAPQIPPGEVRMEDSQLDTPLPSHIRADGKLSDVLNHPAFRGFAQHLMPWPDRAYEMSMPLREIGLLLPYHSNVSGQEVVSTLNRMVDDQSRGRQVFYELYSEREIEVDPAKGETGLFFFRGDVGAPFAVIAPGGGFAYVGSVHEGFPYATAINAHGLNAFVVRYRVGQGQVPAIEDMAAAISFIQKNADVLGVDREHYSVWGSSAGARMAALIGSHGVAKFGGSNVAGPSAVVLAYTSHADVSGDEPPTFVVVGERDGIAPPSAMEWRVQALQQVGVSVEYHLIPGVAHGFGTGLGTPAEGWIDDAVAFWIRAM